MRTTTIRQLESGATIAGSDGNYRVEGFSVLSSAVGGETTQVAMLRDDNGNLHFARDGELDMEVLVAGAPDVEREAAA